MNESLAERQAALRRQNDELNERVEEIEQRRQQVTQRAARSVEGKASVLGDDGHGTDDDDDDSDMNSPTPELKASNKGSRANLHMNLSASIDSFADAKSDASERVADKGRATGPRSSSTGSLARPRSRRENQEGNAREPVDSSKNPDDVAGSPDGLGVEATLRYQKARLRVLQDELDSSTARVKELHAANANLKAKVEELSAECANANKKTQQTQQLFEKQKELVAAQESKQKILETQLATAQTRIDELERAEKQTTLQFRSKDVRLNRALEELEKVKQQLQEDRKTQGEQMIAKTEYESVVKENKRLEKQKSELLVAFKKQMKLIDLLKRQRIHMEAAKMLSFTEEEFSRTLELG